MVRNREKFLRTAASCVGLPYRHGKWGPDAFDNAGFIIYCMKSAGFPISKLDPESVSAVTFYTLFHRNKVLEPAAGPGTIWLFTNTGDAADLTHAMIMLRRWPNGRGALIGLTGGGPQTQTDDDAFFHRAMVSVVQSDYWHNHLAFIVDPFKE